MPSEFWDRVAKISVVKFRPVCFVVGEWYGDVNQNAWGSRCTALIFFVSVAQRTVSPR